METLHVHEPLLVNILGHSAGALVFGIFIVLLILDRARVRLRGSRLTICAAALAFLWNAVSLAVLGQGDPHSPLGQWLVAVSSSVLSLLPALLLHLALAPRLRVLVAAGYALSTLAVVIHLSELRVPAQDHHRFALQLITVGFAVLTALAVWGLLRSRDREHHSFPSRGVATMSLFLFALSFAHLGAKEPGPAWAGELVIHHAGIPLALFVLLQDYRFVLLDAFVRFLANGLLAAAVVFGADRAARAVGLGIDLPNNPFHAGLLLAGGCIVLGLYALLRKNVQRLLTRVVFRQPDIEAAIEELRKGRAACQEENEYLRWAGERLAEFMEAPLVSAEQSDETGAVVPIRLPGEETRLVALGRRRGGRRYLSEDLQALERMGAEIAAEIEQFRKSEMRRLVSQAELRALQAQIHPHFLFNALNTLYGVIPREAKGARLTVLNVADIFRYFLEANASFIPLEKELHIVKAYLEIEALRLGPKLKTEIDVDDRALAVPIPVLSIEPLVENAVKHGVASREEGGAVRLQVKRNGRDLQVLVEDTGKGFIADPDTARVGLDNVTRRLKLCYGSGAELAIQSSANGSRVSFVVPVESEAAV